MEIAALAMTRFCNEYFDRLAPTCLCIAISSLRGAAGDEAILPLHGDCFAALAMTRFCMEIAALAMTRFWINTSTAWLELTGLGF